MASPKSVSDTVSAMAKQTSTTLGWDVVVNYTEPDINKLLSETFKDKSKKQITELKCRIEIPDPRRPTEKIIINYDFQLAAPRLTFNARNAQGPSCNLTLPIVGGTASAKDGDIITIYPGRYSLVLGTLKLVTAKGAADPDTKPYDKPFIIPEEGSKQGCVVIDLETSKDLRVTIDTDERSGVAANPFIDGYKSMVCDAIQILLHVDYKDIRYEIARVKAITPPSGTIQLKPKSFRFHAFLPSDTPKPDDAGVLTLFIQTRDTSYGTQDQLATKWESQWRIDLTCSPIPKDQTASIIFSKNMIFETVIKPALEDAKFTGTLEDTKGSLKVGIKTGKKVSRDALDKYTTMTHCRASSVSVDPLPPLTLLLSENVGSATYAITWEFHYECKWSYKILNPPTTLPVDGKVTATHKIPKDAAKPAKVVTFLDDYSFKLDCSISKDDWGVTFDADKPSGWESWVGKSGLLPEWVTSLSIDLPTFGLPFQSVNFFLTTNLLFPDDKQVIDIDKDTGLHIPADLYLVGKVKSK